MQEKDIEKSKAYSLWQVLGHYLLLPTIWLILCTAGLTEAAINKNKPNVIIILADDLGYGDTIEVIDWSMGKITAKLKQPRLEDNTLNYV